MPSPIHGEYMDSFHALGAGAVRSTLGNLNVYINSWSYESTGTTVADVLDSSTATLARSAAGIYTHTFPSDKKPASVYQCVVTSNTEGRTFSWSYSASTGVLTTNVWIDAAGDGTWEAANVDEEIFYVTAFCKK